MEEPRKEAKWIFSKYHTWICSECGENPLKGTGFVPSKETMKERYRYCSMCGAKIINVEFNW